MKLNYFNGRGLAEVSRILLAVAGVQYEDFRYPLTVLDWSTYKMIREEFNQDKSEDKLWRSLNKVPFLDVDGEVVFQSKSIERFLATKFEMMGSSPLEAAFIDSVCETVRDMKDMYQKVRQIPEEKKEEMNRVFFNETLPNALEPLNRIIASRQTNVGFVVGDKVSLADIVLYSFLVDFFDDKVGAQKSYENCSALAGVVSNVGNMESVKKWLSERPQTPF